MKTKISIVFISMLFILLFVAFSNRAFSQNKDTEGKEFWLMFPLNYNPSEVPTLSLFISSKHSTSGTVTIPGLAFSKAFTVTPGVVTTVALPSTAQVNNNFTKEGKGIKVVANDDISVYGLNRIQYTTDAFCGIPVDALGTRYLAMGWPETFGSQVGIVATQNNTTVTITVPFSSGPFTQNVPANIVLNQGQTFLLNNYNDLSGTSIIADKPVAVFGGNQCANVPSGFYACDFIVEQIPALETWGKRFVTIPLKTRLYGDTYKMLAAENGTTIKLNGTTIATLNKGQSQSRIIVNSSEITSDKPILLAQFSNGSSYDGVNSDPFMIIIPPTEQFLTSYTFTTPSTGFVANFVNVAAPSASIGLVKLDGIVIPSASFSPIGATGFHAAQLPIALGSHTLDGTSQAIGACVYGFDSYDSYGYPAGSTYTPVAVVSSLTLNRLTGTATICEENCWEATIKNSLNEPVAGVRVDFSISGANPGQSGTAITDANGVAKFCYKGNNAGDDVIKVSLGTLLVTANFTWTWADCRPDTDGDGVVDEEDCAPNDPNLYKYGMFYLDEDGDGYSDGETDVCYGETLPSKYITTFIGNDCDDADPYVYRNVLVYFDEDGDGFHDGSKGRFEICIGEVFPESSFIEFTQGEDCDDKLPSVHPSATELCDGIDNDCDGSIDEGCSLLTLWYRDVDKDGYGGNRKTVLAATQPKGYVSRGGDCNDADPSIYPNAPELGDGRDNNCNGQIDEGLPCLVTWYRDADGDGFGVAGVTKLSCTKPADYVLQAGDCRPLDPTIYPGAPELADGKDNDCNGQIDDGLPCLKTWYFDFDGDGFGRNSRTRISCIKPAGFVEKGDDCDDLNANVYPGSTIGRNCGLPGTTERMLSSKTVEEEGSPNTLVTKAFPNPHDGSFIIEVHSPVAGKGSIVLYDLQGRTIVTREEQLQKGANQVRFTNLKKMNYMYRVMVNGQSTGGKVLSQ